MYRVDENLIPSGTHEFKQGNNTDNSPLAGAILSYEEVVLLLIAPRFITVRKQEDASWETLSPKLHKTLREFISSGEMAIFETAKKVTTTVLSPLEQRISDVLARDIAPALASDGGNVVFVSFDDGVVSVALTGACDSCPSASMTLKMGIEAYLVEEFVEVTAVEQVFL